MAMNNSWMFVGALLVVAAVPFVMIGAIRFIAWAAPAHARWVAAIERRHYRAYWLAVGGTYLAFGVAHFVREDGEPIARAAFSGPGVVYVVQGLRGRCAPSTEGGLAG